MTSNKRTGRLFGVVAVALALALTCLPAALARVSCIQTTEAVLSAACSCGDDVDSFMFSVKGTTSVDANTVRMLGIGLRNTCEVGRLLFWVAASIVVWFAFVVRVYIPWFYHRGLPLVRASALKA